MVTICFDAKKQYNDQHAVEINGYEDYIPGYIKILSSLHERKDCLVIVRKRQIYDALKNQEKFYAHDMTHIVFSVIDDFKKKFNVDVPDYITEADIVDDESLKDIDFNSGEEFENAVLRREYGTYFLGESFPFASLAQLCKNISLEAVQDKKRIVLRKVFKNRLRDYEQHLSGSVEKYVFEQFINDFEELKTDVAVYLIVKNFPKDFKEDVLGHDLCKCMDYLGVNGEAIAVDRKIEENYRDRFRWYISSRAVDPDMLLSWVSGQYAFELDSIIQCIDENNLPIEDYTEKITGKFAQLFSDIPEEKLKVTKIKPPVELESPKENYDIENWMNWAVNNYLPYHFWLEENDKHDQSADQYAGMFGDWIFSHYDELINNYSGMMYRVLPGLKEELLQNEHTVFVVLDNFNYKFLEFLISCLEKNRFVVQEESPVLAMIPTETVISKRAFFTAEAYNDNGDKYDKIVRNWAQTLGIEMEYLPNVGTLKSLANMDKKVYFLNYLRLDEMLHEDQNASAQRIEVRIQKELEALINEIISTLRKFGREKDTNIYFIADHGSTKILPEQPNEIDPKYYKDKAQEANYRCIEVDDEDYENTRAAIGGLCYALDRQRYGTDKCFFIARGYNRFIKNELQGYVHGGITPEEAIVPLVKSAYDMDMCKNPEITLVSENLRFAVTQKLTFLVKNFNDFPIENIELIIQNNNVKCDKIDPITVNGLETGTIDLTGTRITKSMDKKNNEKLYIMISYSANGRNHRYQSEIGISVKSAQGHATDLSDLL